MTDAPVPNNPFDRLYPITQKQGDSGGIVFNIFLMEAIEDASEFAEIISVLDAALDTDTVVFKINSPGGYKHSTLSVIDAIRASKAQTIAECTGTVASAATIIALACDGLYIADHSTFMVHNYTGGVYGKGHEIIADIEHTTPNNTRFVEESYRKFLSKKEIKKLINGKDYYFTAEETRERWVKVIDERQRQLEADAEQLVKDNTMAMIGALEAQGYMVVKDAEGIDIA